MWQPPLACGKRALPQASGTGRSGQDLPHELGSRRPARPAVPPTKGQPHHPPALLPLTRNVVPPISFIDACITKHTSRDVALRVFCEWLAVGARGERRTDGTRLVAWKARTTDVQTGIIRLVSSTSCLFAE